MNRELRRKLIKKGITINPGHKEDIFSGKFLTELTRMLFMYNQPTLRQVDKEGHGSAVVYDTYFIHFNPTWKEKLESIEGFISKDIYPNSTNCPANEIGCRNNLRILLDDSINQNGFKIQSVP